MQKLQTRKKEVKEKVETYNAFKYFWRRRWDLRGGSLHCVPHEWGEGREIGGGVGVSL